MTGTSPFTNDRRMCFSFHRFTVAFLQLHVRLFPPFDDDIRYNFKLGQRMIILSFCSNDTLHFLGIMNLKIVCLYFFKGKDKQKKFSKKKFKSLLSISPWISNLKSTIRRKKWRKGEIKNCDNNEGNKNYTQYSYRNIQSTIYLQSANFPWLDIPVRTN